jgi:signal transduction histidine kinase
MKRTRFFLLVILIHICLVTLAQKDQAVSTIKLIDSLNEMAFKVKRYDIVKALDYLSAAQNLSTQNNYRKGLAVAYLYEAGIYQQSGFSSKALSIYYKALEEAKATSDSFTIARCNVQIAGALKDNNSLDSAQKLYNESLQTFEKLNKVEEVVNTKNNIGQLFVIRLNYNEARKKFNEALQKSLLIKYSYGEKKAYQNLGFVAFAEKDLAKAKSYFSAAKAIDEKENDYYGLSLSNINLAKVAQEEKQYNTSLQYGLAAYDVAKISNASALMDSAIYFIIASYQYQNNYAKASAWQDTLIKIMKQQGKKDKQYAISFIDIFKNQEVQKLAAQKQFINANQVAKNRIIIILLGSIILLIVSVIAFIAHKNYKKQQHLGIELQAKNSIIEKNVLTLDELNKAISEQNTKLEDKNKMKDKLLSIISHDLRHPMVNTKSIVELINMGVVSEEETKELMVQLEGQYVKSIGLLDNLLFWLRGQMKGNNRDKKSLDIQDLISGLIDEQSMALINKQITIENIDTPTPPITADKEMLKIVFRNLINNAIKFSQPKSVIYINWYKEPGYLCIAIKDNGVGMNVETLQKVNAKNYYSSTGTSKEKGTGFGLILCRDLIANHDGELVIDSELNIGSTFTVKLPLDKV